MTIGDNRGIQATSGQNNINNSAKPIKTHLALAIISLIMFWPLGIISLIQSSRVNKKTAENDLIGAASASKSVVILSTISIIFPILSLFFLTSLFRGFSNDFTGNGMNEAEAREYLEKTYPDLEIDWLKSEQYIGQTTKWNFTEKGSSGSDYFTLTGEKDGTRKCNYISLTERKKLWQKLSAQINLEKVFGSEATLTAPLGTGYYWTENADNFFQNGNRFFVFVPEKNYNSEEFLANSALLIGKVYELSQVSLEEGKTYNYNGLSLEMVVLPDEYFNDDFINWYQPNDFLTVAKDYLQIYEYSKTFKRPKLSDIKNKYQGIHVEKGTGEYEGLTIYAPKAVMVEREERFNSNGPGLKNRVISGLNPMFTPYKETIGWGVYREGRENTWERLYSSDKVYNTPFSVGGSDDFRNFCMTVSRGVPYYLDESHATFGPKLRSLNDDNKNFFDSTSSTGSEADIVVGEEGLTGYKF